ncbi:hypothetical protein B566_EDAN011186 [Ephemera danica]|nr:hypothetical protein B566_EDAN011186 [Ephemera danica]
MVKAELVEPMDLSEEEKGIMECEEESTVRLLLEFQVVSSRETQNNNDQDIVELKSNIAKLEADRLATANVFGKSPYSTKEKKRALI